MLIENTDAWVGSATLGSRKHMHIRTQIFVTRFGFKVFKVNDSVWVCLGNILPSPCVKIFVTNLVLVGSRYVDPSRTEAYWEVWLWELLFWYWTASHGVAKLSLVCVSTMVDRPTCKRADLLSGYIQNGSKVFLRTLIFPGLDHRFENETTTWNINVQEL